jgi:hypothetical protein
MELNKQQVGELLLQGLETERGGVQIYTTALKCVVNEDLKEEWEKYLEQTQKHETVMLDLVEAFGVDPNTMTPGRQVVHHIGESLVQAMEMALKAGEPAAAELVACECVTLAETKDHLNWELMAEVANKMRSTEEGKALKAAYEEVEEEEDEHLYHTQGWARELWIQALGMPAVVPPPEEEKDVKTAIGAARAKKARKEML